ncbi:MAG: hypothetical protein A4E53_01335 [Pelotomaculum sp. PtaB.Bin104]|nr:MAG: hypothetical protein A4E53_01335 [Pelotomaculum sp. PtaB.Bin104]
MLRLIIFLIVILCAHSPVFAADIFEEKFENYDMLDSPQTSAYIDTVNHWARLPDQSLSSAIAVVKDSPGFVVATKEGIKLNEYDDSTGTMRPNNIFSCPWATDSTGAAIRQDNLNIWGITPDSLAYYRFNGSGMSNDPALKATGLNNVISVAGFQNRDSAILLQTTADKEAKITRYDAGANLTAVSSINPDIEDPIAVSMVNDSPDFRLFTNNAVYYFAYDDATGLYVEDPANKITGFVEDITSGSSDDSGNSVLTNSLDYYMNLDGGGAVRVDSFSPGPVVGAVSVSLRPDSYDQVFLDATGQVQWWTYDDVLDTMRRDFALEASGFNLNTGYVPHAEYLSKQINSINSYKLVRVVAIEDIPAGTTINYQVSVNGSAFINTPNNAWTTVPISNKFYLKVLLNTSDSTKTPFVRSPLKLEVNTQPDQPILPVYGACFTTTTPELTWTFSDPDPGDIQGAYQVQISRTANEADIFLDTGKVLSSEAKYDMQTSSNPAVPGPLWSSGVYQYKYRIKVWDNSDAESDWSNWGDFCVIAFERPRIAQIVNPPPGQFAPDPFDPTTHILITPGMTVAQLPRVEAGTKAVLLADTLGPLESFAAVFPYLGLTAATNIPGILPDGITANPLYPLGSAVNRWSVEFWTQASLEVCPTGTVVQMWLDGDSTAGAASLHAPAYADGVVVTEGSILDNWSVVLQGRD